MYRTVPGLAAAASLLMMVTIGACARQDAAATEFPHRDIDNGEQVIVRTVEVERKDFVEYGRYYGEVRAISQATLLATAGGTVEALFAAPGDTIRSGQSLARIEADRAEAVWETAVLAERLAREAYERENRFLQQGLSSQQRVDQMHLEWLRSRTDRIDAETIREGALAITPLDGIVTARHVDLHEELRPGGATYSVADLSRMKVIVGVPEADIAGVRTLGAARVCFASFPGRTWDGRTTSFARRRSDRRLTFDVEIEIDNRDGLLLAGQTAQVELALRTLAESVLVPSRSLVMRAGQASVFVVTDGVAVQRHLRLGPSNSTHTVVTEGLDGGELLVVEGMNRLSDGTAVRPMPRE